MNIGDIVIAKDNFHMKDYNYEIFLLKGKSYRVNELDSTGFFIHSEYFFRHHFTDEHFNQFFTTLKETRKLKLEEINDDNL